MHRLRDLDRRQRTVAAVLVTLMLVPFGASIGRVVHVAWLPMGDNALIGLRALDVWSRHLPLVGQPSTSHLYGPRTGTAHPGPIEFYWLAVPMRILGPTVGMITGAALVNVASVLVAAWVVLRRAGPAVAAWSLVGLAGVLWSEGTAVLSDPISSNVGGIPLLALACLVWAVADGDVRLLPLAVLFGSWVAQQHLAIVVPAASLVAVAAGGVVFILVAVLRRRGAGRRALEGHGADVDRLWPWLVAAAAIAVLAWLPVAWQQLTGDPGNLTAIVDYARSSERPPLGWDAGWRTAAHAVGLPPLLSRSDLSGFSLVLPPVGPLERVVAGLTYLGLLVTAVLAWRRQRPLALLAATTLVLAFAGVYNTSTIPASIEASRINFYRWTFVVAWLAWTVLGWWVLIAAGWLGARGRRPIGATVARVALVANAAILVIAAVASVATAGADDVRRDQPAFRAVRHIADAAVAEARGHQRVTLVLRGSAAPFTAGSAVTLQLEAAGHSVVLPGVLARTYGQQRVLDPGDDPGQLILELISARGALPDGPGRAIARREINARFTRIVEPLVDQARRSPVRLGPRAEELLRQRWPDPRMRRNAREQLARISTDPYSVLVDPVLFDIVDDGYFASPGFDPAVLAAAARAGPPGTVWGDDVFELRVLSRADLAQEAPSWAKG